MEPISNSLQDNSITMRFIYKARTKEGVPQKGTVDAASQEGALEVLTRHGLIPVSLSPEKGGWLVFQDIKFERVSSKDLVAFFRSFASLFEAGVPLVEGLRILAEQAGNVYFRGVLLDITDKVEGGMKLSQAFSNYPKVFSEFSASMIKAGEVSGSLQKTLGYLADYTEREYHLRSSVRTALIYPLFIVGVFVLVFLILMVFVIPRLSEVLSQIAGEENLPFLTRAILSLSKFTKTWILVIVGLIVGGIGWLIYYLKTIKGREEWHYVQLHIPIFKGIFKLIYQARFADNFSILIHGGIPILEAINITADVVGNTVYEKLIREIGEEVKAGNTIESVVKRHEEFSPFLVEMVAVGERSGKLEEVLDKVATFYQKEVDRAVAGLTGLIEPVLIVILGVGVGFLVASIIIPIYTVISKVGG